MQVEVLQRTSPPSCGWRWTDRISPEVHCAGSSSACVCILKQSHNSKHYIIKMKPNDKQELQLSSRHWAADIITSTPPTPEPNQLLLRLTHLLWGFWGAGSSEPSPASCYSPPQPRAEKPNPRSVLETESVRSTWGWACYGGWVWCGNDSRPPASPAPPPLRTDCCLSSRDTRSVPTRSVGTSVNAVSGQFKLTVWCHILCVWLTVRE